MANIKCKECGCDCNKCTDHDVQLHVEIENLTQKLFERENHIVMMETNFLNEANKFPSGELVALRDELLTWQDKYKRLYEAHRRVQRVNQGLEDKLLKLVDVCETDKTTLTKDVATLSHKLAEANYAIKKLTEDNERYKNDLSLAIQFLQCKQSNFVSQKFDSLSPEVQSQVSMFMTSKRKPEERRIPTEIKSIKVPIPTFPPTAMVYSVPKSPKPDRKVEEDTESPPVDIVSAAIMAKVLEERQKERATAKHCDTCTCAKNLKIIYDITHHSIGTQTGDYKEMLCIRCNDVVQLNKSTGVKLVSHVDIISNKVPIESLESSQNIVKVQPNNFLIDTKSKTTSNNSSLINLINTSPKNDLSNPNNHVIINSETNTYQDVMFYNVNEKRSPKIQNKVTHHHLCDKSSPTFEVDSAQEKADSEMNIDKSSAKNASSDNLRGPRYCSMRMQSGSKNILLDNTHNNVAPVLYTRSHRPKKDESPKTHETSADSVSSSGKNNISLLSDNSVQNQQRVADWIQSTLENDVSSSDNSRCDSVNRNVSIDKEKYAEMEENVKRFLFGESEFLKTVELGKLKYQIYQDDCASGSNQSVNHTETDI